MQDNLLKKITLLYLIMHTWQVDIVHPFPSSCIIWPYLLVLKMSQGTSGLLFLISHCFSYSCFSQVIDSDFFGWILQYSEEIPSFKFKRTVKSLFCPVLKVGPNIFKISNMMNYFLNFTKKGTKFPKKNQRERERECVPFFSASYWADWKFFWWKC